MALYALVAGTVRFPIGAGYLVPTYVILVPMLLLLPPGAAPLLAAAAWLVASLGRWLPGAGGPSTFCSRCPTPGTPSVRRLVLIVAGTHHGSATSAAGLRRWPSWPAACSTWASPRCARRPRSGVAPRVQLRVAAQVWLIDGCIAPLGLLLALAARHDHPALLMVLPLGALLLVLQRDRTHRIVQAQERLELAITDPLTRLGNRRKLLGRPGRADPDRLLAEPLVLMVFDLDGFKAYNDTFGHMAGDALLARMGRRLAEVVGPDGNRLPAGRRRVLRVLRAPSLTRCPTAVAGPPAALREDGETFSIAASGGAVLLPHDAIEPDYALQLADERMYVRKQKRHPSAAREQTRDVLVRIMQAKQPGLNDHSSEVSRLAVAVGRRLGMDAEQIDELARAADLHDIGKVGIPDAILDKPGRLESDGVGAGPPAHDPGRAHPQRGSGAAPRGPNRPVQPRALGRSSATPTAWPARRSRWPPGSCPPATPTTPSPQTAATGPPAPPPLARAELIREAGRQFDPAVVAAVLDELDAGDTRPSVRPLRRS